MTDLDKLSQRFRAFATTSTARAPLYGRLAAGIAEDEALLRLLHAAPEPQQIPVLLFAAVHDLLLSGLGIELREHYPNLSDAPTTGDPVPLFRSFCMEHATALQELITTHHTQTNEVGRCAQLLPALGLIEAEAGPLALVDVGTSAGLNLLLGYYRYDYRPGGPVGPHSTVHLECATRGPVPVPGDIPAIAFAVGLDAAPIDVTDDDAVRWLEACVWPDQADRFSRLTAAIELARTKPPDVRRGDAVEDLPALVREAARHGHPVVANSWSLNYLTGESRIAYLVALERLGSEFDISWVLAESPAQTPELPVPTTVEAEHLTVLSTIRWRRGERHVDRQATTHPHGYWLHWESAQ